MFVMKNYDVNEGRGWLCVHWAFPLLLLRRGAIDAMTINSPFFSVN